MKFSAKSRGDHAETQHGDPADRLADRGPVLPSARQFVQNDCGRLPMSTAGKKTIALVLPDLRAGGAERVALRLMTHFLAAGHRVEFVLMQERGELVAQIPPNVTIVDLKANRARYLLWPLIRYFRRSRPDAAQVSMWPLTALCIAAHRIARSSARLVVSDHAALSLQYASKPLTLAVLKASVRLLYPKAHARVIVASGAADDLAKISHLPRSIFQVIHNPVDGPPEGLETSAKVEALWGQQEGRILTVASLKKQKNHALLIRSFARLRKEIKAKLMIVGAGPLLSQLRDLANSLGIGEDVILPGFIAQPWAYYASADLFALSSDYEGYPLVMLEAMRCGLPIVSTDCVSGPREILGDGKYGLLVPVGDEAKLAEAMVLALKLSHDPEVIRQRAAELSGESTAQQYLNLLVPSS